MTHHQMGSPTVGSTIQTSGFKTFTSLAPNFATDRSNGGPPISASSALIADGETIFPRHDSRLGAGIRTEA